MTGLTAPRGRPGRTNHRSVFGALAGTNRRHAFVYGIGLDFQCFACFGWWDDPRHIYEAYDAAARAWHGEFASLNFPRPGEQSALRRDQIGATA